MSVNPFLKNQQGSQNNPFLKSNVDYGSLAKQIEPPKEEGFFSKMNQFVSGMGTGVLSTARQSSELLGKVGQYIPENIKKLALTTPVGGALTLASKVSPAMTKIEESVGAEQGSLTKVPETTAGKIGYYGERVGEFISPSGVATTASIIKKPLTLMAEKLYQSALKPKNITVGGKVIKTAEEISKIGLEEKVWLTKGGVERTANKIDDFENTLGEAIEQAKNQGIKIKTQGLKGYLDEAKKFFENQVDVKEAEKAIQEINDIGVNFISKYGKEIPIEVAQKIKVSTGQLLKKYYDRLTSAGIEGQKQATRFLKEKIVESAPIVNDINQRLRNLYTFDTALSKASNRIGNLNLLGLGTKIGLVAAGSKGAAIGLVADLLDSPAIKSGGAILLNEVGKLGAKGAIPINALLGLIRAKIEESQ